MMYYLSNNKLQRPLAPATTVALAFLLTIWGCVTPRGGAGEAPETTPTREIPHTDNSVPTQETEPPAEVQDRSNTPLQSETTYTTEPDQTDKKYTPEQVDTPAPAKAFHDNCAELLGQFVDERGMVDYRTLKRKRLDLLKLLDLFKDLDRNIYKSWPIEDRMAFWVNAYNIKMLDIIVENYPIQSSRALRILWGPNSTRHIKGIWDRYKFIVMDEEFTLSTIEQTFFRNRFDNPGLFMAACNATASSPPLRNEPYYGSRLNEQLEDQSARFIRAGHAIRIDRDRNIVGLSAIFQPGWLGGEFTEQYATDRKFKGRQAETRAVLNFLSRYLPDKDVLFLETGNYTVEYLKYDWTINDSAIRTR